MHASKPSYPRLLALDNLRGLAALYVVLFHTALVPKPNLVLPIGAEHAVMFGGTGVLLFFVISGFSLSMTMTRHNRAALPILSYATSRFFRIAPLFYTVLLASILRDTVMFHGSVWLRNIALNASFLFNFVPGHQEGIVWASWTIGVEMVYYAIFPLIYLLNTKSKIAVLITALAFHLVLIVNPATSGVSYFSVVGYIPVFICGELAFSAYRHLRNRESARIYGAWALTIGLLLLLGCLSVASSEGSILLRLPTGAGYALLVLGACLMPIRPFESKILGFYGRISYSRYLCHAPIIFALSPIYQAIQETAAQSISYALCVLLALTVATPVAFTFYHLIERPGQWLGKKAYDFLLKFTVNRLSTS